MDVDDDDDDMAGASREHPQPVEHACGDEEEEEPRGEGGEEGGSIPLKRPRPGKAAKRARVAKALVGQNAKPLITSFCKTFLVSAPAGRKGDFATYHFVRLPNAAEKAQGYEDWPLLHEIFNEAFFCNVTQGIFWGMASGLGLASSVDSTIHGRGRQRWACGSALLGGASADKPRYNQAVLEFQALAARYTHAAEAADAEVSPFEHLHRRLRTEYDATRTRAIKALVAADTGSSSAAAGSSAAAAGPSAAAGSSAAEPAAAGGAAAPQSQARAEAAPQAPTAEAPPQAPTAAPARVDPLAFGSETVIELRPSQLDALVARYAQFAIRDPDAVAFQPVLLRFMEHLRVRMPPEGVQYPMSADEVWLHNLIIEVDRARKHKSKHVTTARNHLRRHEQAVAAHDALLRDAHPPPVGPEAEVFEEASQGEGEHEGEEADADEDEADGMAWGWEDSAAEFG